MNISNKALCDTCQANYTLNALRNSCDCKYKSCVNCVASGGVCT